MGSPNNKGSPRNMGTPRNMSTPRNIKIKKIGSNIDIVDDTVSD